MRYAIVENGIVTNIAVSNIPVEPNWYAIPIGSRVSIGDSYLNGCFYSPDGTLRMSPDAEQIYLILNAQLAAYEAAYTEGVNEA